MQFCFVLIPRGSKTNPSGWTIDFDQVYERLLQPAIVAAGLEPLRANFDKASSFTQPILETLLLCPFAIADLTDASPDSFYVLGVRRAARPGKTVVIAAEGSRLPSGFTPFETIFYKTGANGKPDAAALSGCETAIRNKLRAARNAALTEIPVYQIVDGRPQTQLDHEKADIFRDCVNYSPEMKARLAQARATDVSALNAIERQLGGLAEVEAGILIDLLLSYRSLNAYQDVVSLIERMSTPLQQTVMVQEQYALALNRLGRRDQAERVALEILEARGPSSETYGILGRIYKDRWDESTKAADSLLVRGLLDKAIDTYLKGFEADWRDAYPGINAITLMELRDPPDERRHELLPVVRYAVERRIARGMPDYWDHATILELAILAGDEEQAAVALSDALRAIREVFEPDTTARNLALIVDAKKKRGELQQWMEKIVEKLIERARPQIARSPV